jgi:hypothetical protein
MIDHHQNMGCRKGFKQKSAGVFRLESKCGKPLRNSNVMKRLISGTKRLIPGTESDFEGDECFFFEFFSSELS